MQIFRCPLLIRDFPANHISGGVKYSFVYPLLAEDSQIYYIYIYTVFLVDTTNYSSRLLPITPLQINIASEKWWLEKDFLFGSFLGSMLYFAGVHCHSITLDIHQLRLFFEPHPPRLRTPKWSSTKLQEELFKTADMFLLVVFFGINVLYLVILVM